MLKALRTILAIALILVCLMMIGFQQRNVQAYGALIFEDLFTSLNSKYWNAYITNNSAKGWPWNMQRGQPSPSSAIGRGAGNYLDYDLPSFVATGSGLTLTAQSGSMTRNYTWTGSVISSYPTKNNFGSGVINTPGFTFQDAYVEVKAKMPYSGNGSWPSIWFLPGPGGSGGEIDLFEGGFTSGSLDPDTVFACNLHTSGNVQYKIDTRGVKLSEAYHTYGMAYRPGQYVEMYLDGVRRCSYTTNVPTGPYFIILNNGMASSKTAGWHSQVNGWTLRNDMKVEYVRVYNLT